VTITHRVSQGPLHLLIDSTGIKVEGEGEWNARKHGGTKRRVWRKVHLGIKKQTLKTRAVEVTSNDVGDAPMLPGLLSQIPSDQKIASVTPDGAHDTRKCHDAIAKPGAAAVLPPRKNAKPWQAESTGAAARDKALRAANPLGRALWRRWTGYHRRRRAVTKMHCIKLPGQPSGIPSDHWQKGPRHGAG
jgi:Transposase DDE domain